MTDRDHHEPSKHEGSEYCSVRCPQRIEFGVMPQNPLEDSGPYSDLLQHASKVERSPRRLLNALAENIIVFGESDPAFDFRSRFNASTLHSLRVSSSSTETARS
jgi:hypothetical protein